MLTLTPEILAAAYDYIVATPPFNRWNMPDSSDIKFIVSREPNVRGWYRRRHGRHEIGVSSRCNGHTISVLETMAHEATHLHQAEACMENKAQHNRAFTKLADRVCKYHGFDPRTF